MIWLPAAVAAGRFPHVPAKPAARVTEPQTVHPHPDSFIDLELSDLQARADDARLPSRNFYVVPADSSDRSDAPVPSGRRSRDPADTGRRLAPLDNDFAGGRERVLDLEVIEEPDGSGRRR